MTDPDLAGSRSQLALYAIAAQTQLLMATILSTYKPRQRNLGRPQVAATKLVTAPRAGQIRSQPQPRSTCMYAVETKVMDRPLARMSTTRLCAGSTHLSSSLSTRDWGRALPDRASSMPSNSRLTLTPCQGASVSASPED